MKYSPAKQSCLTSPISLMVIAFWLMICMYPAFWHITTDDSCYRRYGFWRTSSHTVGHTSLPIYDFYHKQKYPVHNAVIRKRADLLKQMPATQLKSNQTDGFNMTALAYAARYGLQNELEILLAHGAGPDVITWNEMTATMHALEKGHNQIALYLIDNGADAGIAGMNGKSAIHLAAHMNQDMVIAKIADIPVNRQKLDLADKTGMTPLDYAIANSSFRAVVQLAASGAECRFNVTPKTDEISTFLSSWQQSGEKPFSMPVAAEAKPGYYTPPINVTIPAELPDNVKPETFRNRGY